MHTVSQGLKSPLESSVTHTHEIISWFLLKEHNLNMDVESEALPFRMKDQLFKT